MIIDDTVVEGDPAPEPPPLYYNLWSTVTPCPCLAGSADPPVAGIYYVVFGKAEYDQHIANGWATASPPS